MDEAGARARINSMTRPPDVKEIEKGIETIRAEKEAAIKEKDYENAAALRDSEKQTSDKLEQILNEWRVHITRCAYNTTYDAPINTQHHFVSLKAATLGPQSN